MEINLCRGILSYSVDYILIPSLFTVVSNAPVNPPSFSTHILDLMNTTRFHVANPLPKYCQLREKV